MSLRLILFDIDGTLVHTGGAGLRAFDRAMEVCFDRAVHIKDISPAGMTDSAIFREVFEKMEGRPPTGGEETALFDSYLGFLRREVRDSELFRVLPGVEDLLKNLERTGNFFLALGTGNVEEGAWIKLARPGLDRFFSCGGFGSDSADRSEILRTAVRQAERKAGTPSPFEAVYVVGDTPRDVAAGKAIGARTVAVASGPFTVEQLEPHTPDLLVPDLSETDALTDWLLA